MKRIGAQILNETPSPVKPGMTREQQRETPKNGAEGPSMDMKNFIFQIKKN
jgi:hypothetical protein